MVVYKKIILLLAITATTAYSISDRLNKSLLDAFEFAGYIQHSTFWDTRQVLTERDGFGIYWPKEKIADACDNDINANGEFNMLPIRTRLEVKINGPKVNTATSWGYIEADFFGKKDLPNLVAMRHAFWQLDWAHVHVRAGQYWHPLYVAEAQAEPISITEGFPYQPYSFAPQIRATFDVSSIKIITALVTQLDYPSDGPKGEKTIYLRDAITPDIHGQVRFYFGNHFFGCATDWKRLKPRLSAISPLTDELFKVNESISSISAIAYLALQYENWRLRSKFVYGENLYELQQISGYAVKNRNICTGEQDYTNTRALSWWIDLVGTKWETLEPALFVGYTKNIGSKDILFRNENDNPIVFARAPNIEYAARVAPRIRWKISKLTIGAEIEYDRAAFGDIGPKGKIENAVPVSNTRLHIALYYYF
jgi:hypothetical protein